MASEIKVDTISEKTSANGVTIDSVNLKDGKVATANSIDSDAYVDGSIDTAHIADLNVTTAKIAADAITAAKIADDAISEEHLDASVITGLTALGATPADTDEFLISDAGTLKKIDYSYIKGGGITAASQWRVTTSWEGDAAPVASNWEEADAPTSYGVLGSSMTESSGIFTFPSTGYWYVAGQARIYYDHGNNYVTMNLYTTHDNSTYAVAAQSSDFGLGGTQYGGLNVEYIFDVTSTSNCKIRMDIAHANDENNTVGNTDAHATGLTFIRLGDT